MTEEVYLSQFWWSWTWCLNWLRSREDLIATTVTMVGATDGASGHISNRKRRMLGWPNLESCNKALKSTEESPTEGLLLGAINDSRPSVRPLLQGSPTFHSATLQKPLHTRDRRSAQTMGRFIPTQESVCSMQPGAARHKRDFKDEVKQ